MNTTADNFAQLSRRGFLTGGVATAALLGLAACAPGGAGGAAGGGGAGTIKFWDMVWGTGADYTAAAKGVAASYTPSGGALPVSYQSIPWANWYQTFTSAAASKTTPSVSSGAAFLPFYFLEEGVVAPADNLVKKLDAAGTNDFLPGLLDAMKTDKGYAAVPWSMDLRVLWYRKSLLEKAGVEAPTDWDSLLAAGVALKKSGVTGFGMAAGSTSNDAQHTVSALLINNGGGFFAPDGSVDCVNDRNIETLDFLNEMVKKGVISPNAASYTSDNVLTDWTAGRIGMGYAQTGLDKSFPEADRADMDITSPITSPRGERGTVYYINPLMMFTTTDSQESSEAFLAWYLDQIHVFWTEHVSLDLPVKKSIADLPAIQESPILVKAINEWQPVGKTIGAQAPAAFGALNAVDGGAAGAAFVQQIVQGTQSSKAILETMQTALEKIVK